VETKNSPAGSQCGRLSPSQKKMLLEESGIYPRLVVGRRYRTIDTKAEPGRLEFSHSQRNVPGLLVPIYGPTGEVVLYQSRPDEPRIDKRGRPGTVAGQKVTSGNVHWFHRMQSGMVERLLQEKKTAEFRADRGAGARGT
jgi:hypothetical protein